MRHGKDGWKCGNLPPQEIPTFPPPRLLRTGPYQPVQTSTPADRKTVNYAPGLNCQLCSGLYRRNPLRFSA